jgi:hypothetical protein
LATLIVPARFNGPPANGNGGYSCGALAAHLDGPAAVSLRRPVPLDQPLEIRHEEGGEKDGFGDGERDAERGFADREGAAVRAFADDELVAEAVPAPPLAPWDGPAVTLDRARAAHDRFVPPSSGEFDRCFVCGRARDDGFHVFAGPLADDDLSDPPDGAVADDLSGSPAIADPLVDAVASPWTPPAWAADADGAVRPEFVWAALDCPGYFALHGRDGTVAYLVRQQVEILTPPRAGETYVAVGRPLERSGRKGLAATAILDAGGAVLAHGECLLVAPREAAP